MPPTFQLLLQKASKVCTEAEFFATICPTRADKIRASLSGGGPTRGRLGWTIVTNGESYTRTIFALQAAVVTSFTTPLRLCYQAVFAQRPMQATFQCIYRMILFYRPAHYRDYAHAALPNVSSYHFCFGWHSGSSSSTHHMSGCLWRGRDCLECCANGLNCILAACCHSASLACFLIWVVLRVLSGSIA